MQRNPQQQSLQEGTDLGKIPPQAVDIEEAILGAMLIDKTCIPGIVSLLTKDSFYKTAHQIIYSAIVKMYDRGKEVDILTVTEYLRMEGAIDEIGGAFYLTTLTERVTSGAHSEEYCRILQEKHIKREIIRATATSQVSAYDTTTDPFDCLAELEGAVKMINEIIASGGNMKHLASILDRVESEARKRERLYKSGQCTGIPTGIKLLDKMTAGWQNGELIILAGRPSMGKTALMLHHALSTGRSVCIYSLEMSDISLVNRMILSVSDLDANRFRAGAFTEEEWGRFYTAKHRLSEMPIYIDDNPSVTTRYIKAHSKMMKDKCRCDIIFIDYLQLADMRSEERGRNREQEVSATTREMKIIAKSLDIPVILLSQLSRACEARAYKKPMLSDLRESGAIEQDADVVIFAYRPDYYGLTGDDGEDMKGIGFEIVAKGRNVGVGEIPFRHNPSMTKIYDYDIEEERQLADYSEPQTKALPF